MLPWGEICLLDYQVMGYAAVFLNKNMPRMLSLVLYFIIYDNIECIRGENLWTYIHISAHSFLIMTLVEEDLDGDHFVSEGTKTQRNYTSCTKTLVMPETVPEVLLFCYK